MIVDKARVKNVNDLLNCPRIKTFIQLILTHLNLYGISCGMTRIYYIVIKDEVRDTCNPQCYKN